MPTIDCTKRQSITIAKMVDGVFTHRKATKTEVEHSYINAEKKHLPRRISYDLLSDAMTIYLIKEKDWPKDPRKNVRTVTVANGVNVDFDERTKRPIAIEILWVSDHLEKWMKKHVTMNPKRRYNILRA